MIAKFLVMFVFLDVFFVRLNPVIIELKSRKKCTPQVILLEWKNISVQQPAQTLQTATPLIFRCSCGV